MSSSFSWTTQDELRWVNQLSARPEISVARLLANVLEAAQRRRRWGDINRAAVLHRISARLWAETIVERLEESLAKRSRAS